MNYLLLGVIIILKTTRIREYTCCLSPNGRAHGSLPCNCGFDSHRWLKSYMLTGDIHRFDARLRDVPLTVFVPVSIPLITLDFVF